MYADPPPWNFPVQACDSNYITLKQTQIIDMLVAKFRKAHNATPQHDTLKTPGQASPNPSNFGDTWKYLCTRAASLTALVAILSSTTHSLRVRHASSCSRSLLASGFSMNISGVISKPLFFSPGPSLLGSLSSCAGMFWSDASPLPAGAGGGSCPAGSDGGI